MASRQLGKLRQWAGEMISSREKTTVTDEFRELEKDIELRRHGAQRLYLASESYQHALSKKKKFDALGEMEKLLPIDALGMVMVIHGEEFGDDSGFGTSLVNLGRAHCKVATLQGAFALTFKDTFMASIERFIDEIKEYDQQKKKLESRRLSYDASVVKFEKVKNSKKEKERKDAEDEMDQAQGRYFEALDDIQALMHSIQDHETTQLRDLTTVLDLEINFTKQYLDVLKDVKSDWQTGFKAKPTPFTTDGGPAHALAQTAPEVKLIAKKHKSPGRSNVGHSSDSSEEGHTVRSISSRRSSSTQRRSHSVSSKPPSRPTSRASRKRSDSTATTGEKEKNNNNKSDKARRQSVAEWASSAVGSVTGRGKKTKDKDKFAALNDGEGETAVDDGWTSSLQKSNSSSSLGRKFSRTKSKESLSAVSPKIAARILKPPSLQGRKVVRALQDFSGSSDELSFKAGDEIVVTNEVLDGWWMGELGGRQGLFPTGHVEVVTGAPAKPSFLPRLLSARSKGDADSSSSSRESVAGHVADDGDKSSPSDTDDDRHLISQPPVLSHSPFYVPSDSISLTESLAEEDDERNLMSYPVQKQSTAHIDADSNPSDHFQPPQAQALNLLQHPPRSTTIDVAAYGSTPPGKKPPPPPPRRSANTTPSVAPPIPERRLQGGRNQSSGSLQSYLPAPASSASSHSYDTSPFESLTELSTSAVAEAKGCGNFKQNPFKPKGLCSNCAEFHG